MIKFFLFDLIIRIYYYYYNVNTRRISLWKIPRLVEHTAKSHIFSGCTQTSAVIVVGEGLGEELAHDDLRAGRRP